MTYPDSRPDEILVHAAQCGDTAAFSVLYERYFPAVYRRVAYSVPPADVEDVTQEIFIAVIRSLKSFRGSSSFNTWLQTLVRRQIADFYRRRNLLRNAVDVDTIETDYQLALSVPSGAVTIDTTIIVRQALGRLPEHYQEILCMRFIDGLQFNEIANQLDKSLEATKSLFRRAVAAIQAELEETDA